jgi:hypothetical protein
MKTFLKYALFGLFVLFVLLSNFTYLNVFLPNSGPFRYCSNKCDFELAELGKGHDPVGRVESYFEEYQEKMKRPELKLYRRFHRKWWQIWNWHNFLTHRRWKHPYAERDEDT